MSTTSLGPSTPSSSIDPLVRQLVERIDRDKDGKISTDEFGSFLTELIRRDTAPAAAAAAPAPIKVPLNPLQQDPPDETPGPRDIPPSEWTDNNAPYGITFAGFSPQNHTDLTVADLGIPGKAEKYAVYMYLLSNRVEPTRDWAPAAAKALNERYNTNVFKAIDGETLGYGTEYVHSAPNGHGMLAGTYDPHARGEFLWGWQETAISRRG